MWEIVQSASRSVSKVMNVPSRVRRALFISSQKRIYSGNKKEKSYFNKKAGFSSTQIARFEKR